MAAPKNPKGAKSDKAWRDALMLAVNERAPDGGKKLRKIAEKCVDSAMAGDMQAIKEIGDRLDGKPAQAITGEGGGPITYQVVTGVPDREG